MNQLALVFDGSIESLITGGVGNYTYQWNTNINDTLEILDSIPANTYYLTLLILMDVS